MTVSYIATSQSATGTPYGTDTTYINELANNQIDIYSDDGSLMFHLIRLI